MSQFCNLGYSGKELLRLNRVRLHQHVLFVSDVMDAGGKAIDRKYLDKRPEMARWSSLVFPIEQPSPSDFRLWAKALRQLRLGSRHGPSRLGDFRTEGHKTWEWRYDSDNSRLLHMVDDRTMDVYSPSLVPGFAHRPNCWTRARIGVRREECATLCTVKETGLAVMSICSFTDAAPAKRPPTNFWDVIQDWGYAWLWEDLRVVGPSDWLASAIATGTCIGVTDGSYMREMRQDVCAAAFFFKNADRTCQLMGSFAE